MTTARQGLGAVTIVVVLAAATPSALAQPIDAGAISQQTQNQAFGDTQAPSQQIPGVVTDAPPPPLVLPPGGATFELKGVVFSPSELLPQTALDAIAAQYVGTEVDLSDLQNIANAVNALYAGGGFVTASAILPAQDLTDGVLEVELVEGRVGAVTLTGRQRLNRDLVDDAIQLESGRVVNAPDLAGDVDLFNRTSAAQVQASLQAGAAFGLTDINLAVIEPPRNSLQFFVDNLGVESVGQYQGGFVFQHYGLLGFDDRLTAYGLAAEGNLFGNLAYNTAITPWGTRAGVSYSRSGIRIVNGPFDSLNVTGSAEVYAANLSHPLINEGAFLLLGNLALSRGTSETRQAGVVITDDTNRKVTLGLNASYFGGDFNATISPTVSFVDADLNVTGQNLDYTLYQISGAASFRFAETYLVSLRGAGQLASQQLLPGSDLFQIGGPATVRGYPSSAASGDAGYYLNLELHRSFDALVDGLEGFVFLDHGKVYSQFPEVTSLTSAGIGLNYTWNDRVRGELSVGFPLEDDVVPAQQSAVVYARIIGTVF
jgi:hemolysin activation/secretion protein